MSLCLRTLPNKVTSFINIQKHVTKIDQHLPKHVKSSPFLEEFLSTQTTVCTTTNCGERPLKGATLPLDQYLPVIYLDTYAEWPEILNKKYNGNQIVRLQQQGHRNIETLNVTNTNFANEFVLNKNIRWLQLHTDSNCFHESKMSCLSHNEIPLDEKSIDKALSNPEKHSILNTEVSPNVQKVNEIQPSEDHKPSEDKLLHVYNRLSNELPRLFVDRMDYSLYTHDLIFINNIKGTATTGIVHYIKQVSLLKILGHLRFAFIKLDTLKVTMHPEDSSVRVRWRIVGITGTHIFFAFWKLKVWKIKEYIDKQPAWYDGFSTFYVNNEGKIYKHVIDKVMPDADNFVEAKTPVSAKLALFSALLNLDYCNFTKLRSKIRFQLT